MSLADSLKSLLSGKDIFANVVATVVAAPILTWLSQSPKLAQLVFGKLKIGAIGRTVVLNLVWVMALCTGQTFVNGPMLALVLGVLTAVTTALSFRGYYNLGIVDAYRKTTDGVDFRRSLKMAKRSIDFLGIGADKLTSLDEFGAAMQRCGTGGNKVRFLLSPADNKMLELAAKRNGVDVGAYGERVKASIRRIADIRKLHALDIEVRFYPAKEQRDLQQFRLMFIDGSNCLVGWTVWGSHTGKENPQVVLRERPGSAPANSAYKAFQDHFEALWSAAKPCDLTTYK